MISIHALRVEGDIAIGAELAEKKISIHALRVEGDCEAYNEYHKQRISIHALRVEGDFITLSRSGFFIGFLSTPSGWRATK